MTKLRAILLGMLALPLGMAGAAANAEDYPELTFKYATHAPANNTVSQVDQFFADRLREKSGGKLNVEFYWNRALGKVQEMLPLIEAGAVDFTTLEPPQYTETQLASLLHTPMIFFDRDQLVAYGDYLYMQDTPVRAEMNRIGARSVFVRHLPHYKLLCTKPYKSLADFKGARLRSYGAYVPIMWEALGANAVNVIGNEMYEGLSKGVYDCAYLPPDFLVALKLYEPAKYLVDFEFGMIIYAPTLVPNVVWDSWPQNVRDLVTEVAAEAQAFGLEHIDTQTEAAITFMKENGVEVVAVEDPDAIRGAIPSMMDAWLAKQVEQGRGEDGKILVDLAREKFGL